MAICVYIVIMNSLIFKGAIIFLIAIGSAQAGYLAATKRHKCPDCVCPTVKIPPCPTPELQSMDFDKIKNVRGLTINQTYQVKADSAVLSAFNFLLDQKLKELKISRCK